MNLMTTLRRGTAALLTIGALAISTVALAQPPGGGGGMPPAMQAKMKAWQKWRENNKNVSNLGTAVRQVQEIDKDPGTKLDKKQAGVMLSIINEWKSKPTMNDDQAKVVLKKMTGILNVKQIQKMQTIQPFGGRGGGGGGRPGGGGPGGGGGRPGGGGGPGGGAFTFPDPPKGGFNPFNADTLPFERMRPMAKKSMNEFAASLKSRK
jgi:hypothetical protein